MAPPPSPSALRPAAPPHHSQSHVSPAHLPLPSLASPFPCLALPGVMELFFTEVSEGTRALGSSINLLTTAVGTYLAGALNSGIAAATARDPWVADNPLMGHYDLCVAHLNGFEQRQGRRARLGLREHPSCRVGCEACQARRRVDYSGRPALPRSPGTSL